MEKYIKTTALRGLSASKGRGRGIAKIVLTAADVEKVQEGDVMVVARSNPAFVTGLFKASAVVSEIGGSITHLAILAREVGVPLITGVENATTIIKDGDNITVNAEIEKGVVEIEY